MNEIESINIGELIPVVSIVGGVAISLVVIIGILAIVFIKVLRSPNGQAVQMNAEETRSFQELERGFRRMEERVESLETLLIDRTKSEAFEHKLSN